MPEAAIAFVPDQKSGEEALGGAMPVAMNVVIDSTGTVRRRPGISAYSEAPSTAVSALGISGLYATQDGRLFAVDDGATSKRVYAIGGGTATALLLPNGLLVGTERPVFAETEAMLAMTAGSFVQRVLLDDLDNDRLAGDPPRASHIIYHGSRLLVNNVHGNLNLINFSEQAAGSSTAGHEVWSGSTSAGFFAADARPDRVPALFENSNEVFAFGASNLQTFGPDPSTIYVPATTVEYGTCAPYSVVKADSAFYWLDHRRRFVSSDGRSFNDKIGANIQETIDDIGVVSDCYGYRVQVGSAQGVVWTFPTDGRSFMLADNGGWSQWSGYDTEIANWKTFAVLSHHKRIDTQVSVVGTRDGYIGKLDFTASTDLGEPIVAFIETGFENRGTNRTKSCDKITVTMRRGQTTSAVEPKILVTWRDDFGVWEPAIEVGMGLSTDKTLAVELYSLGVYRRRQWKFTFSGSEDLILAGVTEEYTVLEI